MLVSLLLSFLLLQRAVALLELDRMTNECIDSQLTGALEYVSIVRYKSIRTTNRNYSCTMITQCSADRLYRLENQVKGWRGATSAAVYIPTHDREQQKKDLNNLDLFLKKLEKDPSYSGSLTVSVLYGHESTPDMWNCKEPGSPGMPLYPINNLRNLAAAATGKQSGPNAYISPYLMYLDADFVPSAGLSDWIDKHAAKGKKGKSSKNSLYQLTHKGDLIVVPAFESSGAAPSTPTRSLKYLVDGIRIDAIAPFHVKRYPAGHGNTNFDKWQKLSLALKTAPEEYPFWPYKVKYTQGFEPYVILARSSFVPYDERFRGYGFNKCVNLRWFAENNRGFHVLPGHFVVEDAHANSITYNKTALNVPVLFRAYDAAKAEARAGRMPLISHKSAAQLREAGFGVAATEDPATHEKYLRSIAKK